MNAVFESELNHISDSHLRELVSDYMDNAVGSPFPRADPTARAKNFSKKVLTNFQECDIVLLKVRNDKMGEKLNVNEEKLTTLLESFQCADWCPIRDEEKDSCKNCIEKLKQWLQTS